jgi:branched-chain amino acid transport system ATP-binding protein
LVLVVHELVGVQNDGATVLKLRGMSRQFGGLRVIQDLQLDVVKGEILGILGPNGAGKSTLFNLISGVLTPDRGSVVYNGRDVTGLELWHRRRLGIGHTHQIPKPFSHMTVFENVLVAAVHGAGLSVRQGRREAADCLALTGLHKRSSLPAGRLTLLDLKRLELARAVAGRPSLLLLDEIAGGLTEAECNTLLDILRALHSQGATIVWVEHVIHALTRLADRLAVLYSGSILATGRPEEVLSDKRVKDVYLGE